MPGSFAGGANHRTGLLVAVIAALVTIVGPALTNSASAASKPPRPASANMPRQDGTHHPVRRACGEPAKKSYATCFALVRTDVSARKGISAKLTPEGYGPADLQQAYKLPSATAGDGELVAIVDAYDDPRVESDLAVYRQQYGLPPCTSDNGCLTKVNQRGEQGDYPLPDAGWAQEISLDVDMVSAACPKCHILLVESDTALPEDLGQAVDTAVRMGAKYVSNSYGKPENSQELDNSAHYDHPGVAITASSGDSGYGVKFPASFPNVTAVGGTTLERDDGDRGWQEQAWSGSSSGCSAYQPKPSFQQDPCHARTVADVAAVADPDHGVAVYGTYGLSGWGVLGGTSASAPLIASAYALAGRPAAGTSPNSYPYRTADALNDVVAGNSGDCGSYLCNGKAGYDGPTGLGTPNGVAAFRSGPYGTLTGTVKNAQTGAPLSGARVTAGDLSTTSGSDGAYALPLPAGTYNAAAAAYGYATAAKNGLSVTSGAQTTADFALTAASNVSVSGTVRDGSGHGWPMYAKLTVDGMPGGPVYSDPFTGRYRLDLPKSATYTMHVDAAYPGYRATDVKLQVGRHKLVQNIGLDVDPDRCEAAPGNAYTYDGTAADFSGWTGTTPKDGWTVTDDIGNGETWAFDNPGERPAPPGGDPEFAVMDAKRYGTAHSFNTSLVSPVVDLTSHTAPEVGFSTDYRGLNRRTTASVDLSLDGGTTWSSLWHHGSSDRIGEVRLPIPQAAGMSAVRIRFHLTGFWGNWWALDKVYVGNRSCTPVPGGIVAGIVDDDNTGKPLNGASVSGSTTASGVSAATPDDARLNDGFYHLFSPSGGHAVTASYARYAEQGERVKVRPGTTTRQDFRLTAGHLRVRAHGTSVTEPHGEAGTASVTFTNDGRRTAHVKLVEQDGGLRIDGSPASRAYAGQRGAPVRHVKGTFLPTRRTGSGVPAKPGVPATVAPPDLPWQAIAAYPVPISDNGVGVIDGKVYSVGGFDGNTTVKSGYVYDPAASAWKPIADMSTARQTPQAAVVAGKLYVFGGWGLDGRPVATSESYDPRTNRWSAIADDPDPYAGAGAAVVDGRIYLVGGCVNDCGTSDVSVYDPRSDKWSRAADYPEPISWLQCGGIDDLLYCAGGKPVTAQAATLPTRHSYVYHPGSNTWASIPDMPGGLWGGGYAAANGELLVSGGVTNVEGSLAGVLTNEGFAYDPAAGTWRRLPNSANAAGRVGSACGLYKIGGWTDAVPTIAASEVLPGYDICGTRDVPWLSERPAEFDVRPGHSVRVTITVDSSTVAEPGTYKAGLRAETDTPYSVEPVDVTMNVGP